MFWIGFTEESLTKAEPEEEGCVGLLVLGEHEERFAVHLWTWSEQQYTAHWKSALTRALAREPSALITDMRTPAQSSHLVWWPMWRIGSKIVFHNQLLFFKQHKVRRSLVDLDELYGFVGEHQSHNNDGVPLSEWTVPVSDVERFLKGGAVPPDPAD